MFKWYIISIILGPPLPPRKLSSFVPSNDEVVIQWTVLSNDIDIMLNVAMPSRFTDVSCSGTHSIYPYQNISCQNVREDPCIISMFLQSIVNHRRLVHSCTSCTHTVSSKRSYKTTIAYIWFSEMKFGFRMKTSIDSIPKSKLNLATCQMARVYLLLSSNVALPNLKLIRIII